MKKIKFNEREKRLIAITAIALFFFINYLLVRPWFKNIQEKFSQVKSKQNQEEVYQRKISLYPQWKSELDALREDKTENLEYLQVDTKFLRHLESKIARESGVRLQENTIEKEGILNTRSTAGPRRLPVRCTTTETSFANIVQFVYNLKNDPSHPQIDSCRIQSKKVDSGEDKVVATLKFSVILKPASQKP